MQNNKRNGKPVVVAPSQNEGNYMTKRSTGPSTAVVAPSQIEGYYMISPDSIPILFVVAPSQNEGNYMPPKNHNHGAFCDHRALA